TSNQTSSAQSKSDKFLFKELGVQITLSKALEGLSYSTHQFNSVDGTKQTALDLTTSGLQSLFKTTCDEYKGDSYVIFASIGKKAGKYPANADINNVDGA